MAKNKASRRMFGALEARTHTRTGKVTSWRARYTGPDTDRHERSFVDQMAGEHWLNDERILIDRGEWTPPKVREAAARARSLQAITLRDWAERSMVNKTLRTSTRDRYRRMLEKRILPALGDITLTALTRMDITSWYMTLSVTLAKEADERRARGYKGNTDGRGALYSAYQVLSSILADAVDHELLDASPAKVKGGLQYETLHEPVVLTSDQMWQLTDLLPDYLQAFVPLLATTGLRKGEMQAPMRRHPRRHGRADLPGCRDEPRSAALQPPVLGGLSCHFVSISPQTTWPASEWRRSPTRCGSSSPACTVSRRRASGPVVPEGLAALLGHSRALALLALRHPCSTTELARRVGVSAGTASRHATALRAAGLVTSTRHGSVMLHHVTHLGRKLAA
ncbi:tyrosine-type recombinase/integrase [Promicromonospora soli]